ncbi:hypothetical protein [Stenotrophomonas maltophilia]|uniref:hypothetical protein n=1 Tax=Stenotrophomonas maltophilia TaxID=40324 RepID=UPI002091E00D|nr:hypothetical protein [Stenotrophomonas maltophilia]MCO5735906.1 hypothetical protein [Stenotrophomonas maltophilia]
MRRYQASVTYHERPGESVPLYSKHPDGLYTESGAKARITREHQTSWQRGLTLATSTIERITGIGE